VCWFPGDPFAQNASVSPRTRWLPIRRHRPLTRRWIARTVSTRSCMTHTNQLSNFNSAPGVTVLGAFSLPPGGDDLISLALSIHEGPGSGSRSPRSLDPMSGRAQHPGADSSPHTVILKSQIRPLEERTQGAFFWP
jgi:hypothetical protein